MVWELCRKLRLGQFFKSVSSGVAECWQSLYGEAPCNQVLFSHLDILISNKNMGLDAQKKDLWHTTARCPALMPSGVRLHPPNKSEPV